MNPDRGLPLTLGVQLAPGPDLPARARAAETDGFDLIVIDPGEHDPMTVLAWAAGATERITILATIDAGDHNPIVLARAAASLDLLSGGRIELHLRAGEIRTLQRAVDLIHRIGGEQPGPVPTREIPVHVNFEHGELLAGSINGLVGDGDLRALDAAAIAADRDPREIRRTAFVGAGGDALHLIVDEGFDTLIWPTVDGGAGQSAERLREQVAGERARRGTTVGSVVPRRKQRRRRPGIDYDHLPERIRVIEPGDPGFEGVRSTYLRSGDPGLVMQPVDVDQVRRAVAWAAEQQALLAVRSGGHGFSGRSTNNGGIVIDLSRLDEITVLDGGRVRVQPGARWGDVAAALAPHGLAISSGDSGGVGVGGLATSGGIGLLSRGHGLTIDRLRSATVVLADGSVVVTSRDHYTDLFFGIRGAGFNFGIVVEFEFDAAATADVGFAQFAFDISADPAVFLQRWGRAVGSSPRDTTSFLTIGAPSGGRLIAHTINVVDAGDEATVLDRLQPLAQVGPLIQNQAMILPYSAIVAAGPRAAHRGGGEPTSRSGLLESVTPGFARDAGRLLRSGASAFFQIRALGGATRDVPPEETAFAHRSAGFSVMAMGAPSRLDPLWDRLRPEFIGLYLNFETGRTARELRDAFPEETLRRLRELKRRYDPGNVFADNFNIDPGQASMR